MGWSQKIIRFTDDRITFEYRDDTFECCLCIRMPTPTSLIPALVAGIQQARIGATKESLHPKDLGWPGFL
jgi:hypothetical protein